MLLLRDRGGRRAGGLGARRAEKSAVRARKQKERKGVREGKRVCERMVLFPRLIEGWYSPLSGLIGGWGAQGSATCRKDPKPARGDPPGGGREAASEANPAPGRSEGGSPCCGPAGGGGGGSSCLQPTARAVQPSGRAARAHARMRRGGTTAGHACPHGREPFGGARTVAGAWRREQAVPARARTVVSRYPRGREPLPARS